MSKDKYNKTKDYINFPVSAFFRSQVSLATTYQNWRVYLPGSNPTNRNYFPKWTGLRARDNSTKPVG